MWTEITRAQYRREALRYASDMTDAEWALVEPHLPAPKGRPRCVPLRGVVEALLYLLRTACPWRLLPRDFPNRSTVQRYFCAWQAQGLWARINFLLVQCARERDGRRDRQPIGQDHGEWWPARLRCGQEDPGTQASHPHRHRRTPGDRTGAR